MFCPNCATPNADGSKFCRSCGANISLVPMALTGQIESANPPNEMVNSEKSGLRRSENQNCSSDDGMRRIFIGVGFLIVAMVLAFNHAGWWFWLLIPAFATMGGGVAEYLRSRRNSERIAGTVAASPASISPPQQAVTSLPRATVELKQPPPSVTEGTTRHLGVENAHGRYDNSPG